MFKNLKIGVKLSILSIILCIFMVMVGVIGLTSMKFGNDALDTVYNDRVVPLRDLKVISDMYAVNIVDTVHKTRDGAITFSEAIKNVDIAEQTIQKKWRDYMATFLVDEEKAMVAQIEPLMTAANRETERLRSILVAGQADKLSDFAARALYPAIDPVSDRFGALIDLQLTVAKTTYEKNDVLYEASRRRMVALIVSALVLGAVLGVVIIRSITGPINNVSALIQRMAKGDLSVEIIDNGAQDETGQMVRATAEIARTLNALAKDLHDLTDAAGEFATLLQGVNDLVEVLTAPLFEVAGVMAKLASGDIRGRMIGAYDGDLRALKGNVNRSLDALVTLLDEISSFAGAMADGDVTRWITGAHQGGFAPIKGNLNKA
ncbi:methyl-accepting chemotaxis protein, partial [bacterium]|nr:methyl-accepting chemotaxis protein [bacterium]